MMKRKTIDDTTTLIVGGRVFKLGDSGIVKLPVAGHEKEEEEEFHYYHRDSSSTLVLVRASEVSDEASQTQTAVANEAEQRWYEIERRIEDISTLQSESKQLQIKAGDDPDDEEASQEVLDNIYLQGMHRRKIRKLKEPNNLSITYTHRRTRLSVVLREAVFTTVSNLFNGIIWSRQEEEVDEEEQVNVEHRCVSVPFKLTCSGHLLVTGGWILWDKNLCIMSQFSLADHKWIEMPASMTRHAMCAAVIGNFAYLTGGEDCDDDVFESNDAMNLKTGKLVPRASMSTSRRLHACVSINNKLYVAGGFDELEDELSSAEVYDPKLDKWERIASMSVERVSAAACALNGMMYMCGGYECGGSDLDSVEVFDPSTGAWSSVQPMPTARYGACAAALRGRVYVCGGGPGATASVISYNPATNEWTREPSMHHARMGHAATVDHRSGLLYVSGGNGELAGKSVESFNPATKKWTMLPSMHEPRRGHVMFINKT